MINNQNQKVQILQVINLKNKLNHLILNYHLQEKKRNFSNIYKELNNKKNKKRYDIINFSFNKDSNT